MSLGERLRRWTRRRRRQRAARKQGEALLREFVYLDEVSVFSLISSRLGSVASEFTATESNSLTGELQSAAAVSAGVLKSEIKSRSEATQTLGTQVLRKATVQTTFKELYDYVESGFVLRPTSETPPDVDSLRRLETALERYRVDGWATPAGDLTRGRLTEIRVELATEDIYQVGAVFGTFLELFQEAPELLSPEIREQLREALSVNAVLSKLLAGLVPVRGRALDHVTVAVADQEWVIHRRVLERLDQDVAAQARPLDVVAVAETSLFWKDIRRVVFSGSQYSLLCRIGRGGLHDNWTPVKLMDVVRRFMPDAAEQIGDAGPYLVAAMNGGPAGPVGDRRIKMRDALQAYGQALAAHYSSEWNVALVTDDLIPRDQSHTWATVEEWRVPFEALTLRLNESLGIEADRKLAATLRHEALVRAGLALLMGSSDGETTVMPEPKSVGGGSRILDTELIAIYW